MLKNVLNFAIFIYLHRYLRCCPECRLKRVEKSSKIISIPKLGYFFGFSIPRVAMFGSGLDRNGFVKNLLWDKHSPFVVEKMFPGQFEGNQVFYLTIVIEIFFFCLNFVQRSFSLI